MKKCCDFQLKTGNFGFSGPEYVLFVLKTMKFGRKRGGEKYVDIFFSYRFLRVW